MLQLFRNCLRKIREFKVLTWLINSPDVNLIKHLWVMLGNQVQSMEAPPGDFQHSKDLLNISWCQTPQHTMRVSVASMPQHISAVFEVLQDGPSHVVNVLLINFSGFLFGVQLW